MKMVDISNAFFLLFAESKIMVTHLCFQKRMITLIKHYFPSEFLYKEKCSRCTGCDLNLSLSEFQGCLKQYLN